jgi:thiol-disulfide isomerase/thioredoxin
MRTLIGLALAASMVVGTVAFAEVKDASRAPDFSLKDSKGKTVKLSSLKGKVVMIDFWATWCEPCKKELPAIDKLAKAYKDAGKDVVILAINIDKDKKNGEKFLKDKGIKHLTVLWDNGQAVAGTYEPPSMPTSYIVDKKGIVRHVNQAYKPGDEKMVKKQIDALLK